MSRFALPPFTKEEKKFIIKNYESNTIIELHNLFVKHRNEESSTMWFRGQIALLNLPQKTGGRYIYLEKEEKELIAELAGLKMMPKNILIQLNQLRNRNKNKPCKLSWLTGYIWNNNLREKRKPQRKEKKEIESEFVDMEEFNEFYKH